MAALDSGEENRERMKKPQTLDFVILLGKTTLMIMDHKTN